MNCKIILPTCLGCLLIVIGVALPLVFPTIFESKLAEKLVISPGSEMLKNFAKTPIPIHFKIYFFNITNPDEVYDGETPILAEIGPYTYRQERQKVNITWNHVLGTVSYNEKKVFHFIREESVGSEDDQITTLNPVFVTIAAKADSLNYFVQSAMQLWTWQFEGFTLFMTRKVKELAFSGYEDPVVAKLYEMTEKPKYASGKTGFMYPKNGTFSPTMEIYSGEMGMHNYQNVYKYNGLTKLDFWGSDYCNMINGTFGSQFPKPIRTNEPLYIFSADLCRSIYLTYIRDSKLGPLTLHRFTNKDVLAFPDESNCFCTDEFSCRPSMVSLSSCKEGAPVVMTMPHFYGGDESDINMVDGMHPEESKHETYLEIEPNTGVPMRVAKRVQLNIALKRYSAFSDFEDVKEVMMPIFWVDERAELPMVRAQALHESLSGPKTMVKYMSMIFLVIGALLILVGLVTFFWGKNAEKQLNERSEWLNRAANKTLIHGASQ